MQEYLQLQGPGQPRGQHPMRGQYQQHPQGQMQGRAMLRRLEEQGLGQGKVTRSQHHAQLVAQLQGRVNVLGQLQEQLVKCGQMKKTEAQELQQHLGRAMQLQTPRPGPRPWLEQLQGPGHALARVAKSRTQRQHH